MKNKDDITYRILFYVLMVFLFLGIIQEHFHVFKFKELLGVYVKTEKPKLTFDDYVSGEFQSQTEKYVSENFGFREPVIRLYNQYVYDFFKKTYNKEIYIGKDGWLYQRDDYVMYYGLMNERFKKSNEEFESQLSQETRSLSKINQILKEYGVNFLVFTLPTKSYIYPEHLRRHDFSDTTFNSTRFYEKQLQDAQVPYINMTPWFCAMQDTIPFSLFYEQGSHWASGTAIAVDSVLRYLEQLNGKPLAHIELGEPYSSTEINSDDCNLGDLLNLAFPPKQPIIYDYPVRLKTDENTTYPNVFFIGTSFYWYMTARTPFDSIFNSRVFSYYNQTYYYDRDLKWCSANEADILYELLSHDDVVYFKNGPQLYSDGFHFFGKALIALCISDERFREKTEIVADSLMKAYDADSTRRGEYVYKAKNLLYCNPEMFEELRGSQVPECRSPRISTVLLARDIAADARRMRILEYVAKRDDQSCKKIAVNEAYRIEQGLPLIGDGNYLTSYDFFEIETSYIMDSLHGSFSDASGFIAQAIEEGKYDDCDMLHNAMTFSKIITSFNNEKSIRNLVEKAEKSGKTFERTIIDEAKWIVNNRDITPADFSRDAITKAFDFYVIEHNFKAYPKSIENIKAKAEAKGKPFYFVMMDDVQWCYKNKNK